MHQHAQTDQLIEKLKVYRKKRKDRALVKPDWLDLYLDVVISCPEPLKEIEKIKQIESHLDNPLPEEKDLFHEVYMSNLHKVVNGFITSYKP